MTQLSDEVERVARAIWRDGFKGECGEAEIDRLWNEWPNERETALSQARAAIAAMNTASDNGRLREALREARLALEPIARRVFNDNGDHTINTEPLDGDVYSACYYAARTVADALRSRVEQHKDIGEGE